MRTLCLVLAAPLAALLAACGGGAEPAATAPAATAPAATSPTPTAPAVTTLDRVDSKLGSGAPIVAGQTAVVNYTGWLYEQGAPDHKGRQFDSSIPGGRPFKFTLGAGQVIKGWDQGVLGMQVGGSRRLTIPAALAYGDEGAGGVIPPGAALVFDVDLLAIE
jgi:FKBP-type peptidyl-prolyl cis-trans isomerase